MVLDRLDPRESLRLGLCTKMFLIHAVSYSALQVANFSLDLSWSKLHFCACVGSAQRASFRSFRRYVEDDADIITETLRGMESFLRRPDLEFRCVQVCFSSPIVTFLPFFLSRATRRLLLFDSEVWRRHHLTPLGGGFLAQNLSRIFRRNVFLLSGLPTGH